MRPLLVETDGGVDVIYHVAHFTWTTPGFNFTLAYSFYPASVCGPTYHTTLAGRSPGVRVWSHLLYHTTLAGRSPWHAP